MNIAKIKLSPSKCPTSGQIHLHGSKSFANRALCIAAMAKGQSIIQNFSDSDDSHKLFNALVELGVKINVSGLSRVIEPLRLNSFARKLKINVGLAGTTSRFLTALCAALPMVEIELTGENRLLERPIGELVNALRELGANITYLGREGSLPLLIKGKNLVGGKCSIGGETSSQFLSSLLMIAPLLERGLEIEVVGKLTSSSYIDMTIATMKEFGVVVENTNYKKFKVFPNSCYVGSSIFIEGDATGAGYLWGIAAISRGRIRTYGIDRNSLQGDLKVLDILKQMGCSVLSGSDNQGKWIEVIGSSSLREVTADLNLLPDSAQTLSVIAACATGESLFTGLHTLRVKETDRLAALECELSKIQIRTELGSDWIRIYGGSPREAIIETYEDHRMAMSFAMLGSIIPDLIIESPEVVTKSFPKFWESIATVGIANEAC
jgi:3-phosphoshikimate 1-carboxyvinyltransferase